jgi:hypothetical protein
MAAGTPIQVRGGGSLACAAMVIRSIPLALACVALLGAACQQQGGGSRAGASPSPVPSSLAGRAQASAHPVSQPVRGATPRPGATPKPAQTGSSVSAVYANALQIDAQHLLAADGARVTSCAGQDMAGCRAALQQVTTSAGALQKDLDANPAPACLKSADSTLRSAITLYLQGAQLGTKGIDERSASELTQGKGLLDLGTTRFRAASTQLGSSSCTVPPPAVAP